MSNSHRPANAEVFGQLARGGKVLLDRANEARDRGDWTDAATFYRAYLDKRPRAFAIWVQLGHAFKEAGKHAEALVAYSHAESLNPRDPDLLLNLGHLHKLMGHREDALAFYRRSSELGNRHAADEFRRLGGHLSMEADAQVMTAAPQADASIRKRLSTAGAALRSFAYGGASVLAHADRARDRRDWPAAAELYERYIQTRPRHAAIWVQYGHALKESGRRAEAGEAYAKALALEPLNADTHVQVGHLMRLSGELERAQISYARAFQLNPRVPGAYEELRRLGVENDELLRLATVDPGLSFGSAAPFSGTVPANDGAQWPSIKFEPAPSPSRPWLPPSLDDYWLPQRLRDYIVERFGESTVQRTEYLMAIVDAHVTNRVDFLGSPEGSDFLANLARRAQAPPAAGAPRASIIIPVYNNLIYTITCVASVLLDDHFSNFEILIGDDGSSDETLPVLSSLGGRVKVIRHPENLGFLNNCNTCAEQATGDYFIFLNNDTIVLSGWLDNLLLSFDLHRNVGFAGSKLLNADGSLQEAGGIFWSDGSAWNFGRNANPRASEFNYFKDVDYCSGASIAVPREIWTKLGGFDQAFLPAYCEDSDLAFRVRDAGYRSVYQPRSELIHHEGKSHGTDTTSGIKAYQVTNGQKFYSRWENVLRREHYSNAQEVFAARDRSGGKPHILFIDHYVPQWDRDAGSRTLYQYVKFFVDRGFQVTFWPDNLNEDVEYTRQLQQMGVEVIYSSAFVGKFEEWVAERRRWIKYVFASRPHVSIGYLDTIKTKTDATVFYYGHDLHWKRLLKEHEITKDPTLLEEAEKQRALEESVLALSDQIFYPSREECDHVRGSFPNKRVTEFPIYMYTADEVVEARRHVDYVVDNSRQDATDVFFVGGFSHRPNLDGVEWFLREVEPIMRRLNPKIQVLIAGSNAPEGLCAMQKPGVEVLGRISDERLRRLHETCGAMIVPLRYGAGVKGKIIDAFAKGLPVVSTPVGVQGVDDPDQVAFVAEAPADFARAVVQALQDRKLAATKARNALNFIEQHYTEDAVVSMFRDTIPELAQAQAKP